MTSIEWTDAVWNAVRGCSRVSPGCDNCYAMRQAHRFNTPERLTEPDPTGGYVELDKPAGPYHGLTTVRRGKVDWSGRVRLVPEMLDAPLRWRKPRRVFVNSMSDLFHESLSNDDIAAVFGVMACVDRHTFQVLTKRSQRMREWFSWIAHDPDWCRIALHQHTGLAGMRPWEWPLKNVWLGVSAEDQQRANERIPDLLATPAAVRFVSAEPLIGPIDLSRVRPDPVPIDALTGRWSVPARDGSTQEPRLHWIIVGGESGPGARPCAMEWIERIVEQCRAAGVACFVKQLGKRVTGRDCEHGRRGESCGFVDRKGGDPAEWPADLRVREFPR